MTTITHPTSITLPAVAVQKLREAANQPEGLRRSAAIDAAVAWCKIHYPQFFQHNLGDSTP